MAAQCATAVFFSRPSRQGRHQDLATADDDQLLWPQDRDRVDIGQPGAGTEDDGAALRNEHAAGAPQWPHHQGAVDNARIVLQYGTDPDVRKFAESVIAAQEAEIKWMNDWLAKNGG